MLSIRLDLCPRLDLPLKKYVVAKGKSSASGKVLFQRVKHTSEHCKYDEFMCIMYEAIARKKREMYANKQAEEEQDKFAASFTV